MSEVMRTSMGGEMISSLVHHVQLHPSQTPKELAAFLGVTTRTLRTYVSTANKELDQAAQICLSQGGYVLVVYDQDTFDTWSRTQGSAFWSEIPSTPSGRIFFLLNDLLSRSDWVTSESLASALFCSKRTVANALTGVETYLNRFGLELERRPHRGIRVRGSEVRRRICMANITLDRMAADGSLEERVSSQRVGLSEEGARMPVHHDFQLDVIARCVDAATSAANYQINTVAYQNLLVHIAIAIVRIRAQRYAPGDTEHISQLKTSAVWAVATDIAARVSEALQVELPESEVAYIAIHLAGKHAVFPVDPGTRTERGSDKSAPPSVDDAVSEEAWSVASRMVEAVDQVFSLSLTHDLELRMNLARHLGPLSVRLRYRMRMENPLLADIRSRYPFAYACAIEASRVLVETYDREVSDDETGYLALAFALAIERSRMSSARPKNVLVVCASGMGSAQLLAIRCREEFGDQLGSIETCDVSQLDRVDFSSIDYVFTTVPLPVAVPVPVREVGYFLDKRDVDSVRDLLQERADAVDVLSHFDERLFFPHLQASSSTDAIVQLSRWCRDIESISPRFTDYTLQREASASTAFGNGVAMPHPLTAASERTFVCVGLADEPISWGGQQVSVILLISVCSDGSEDLHAFYDALLSFASDKDAVASLLEQRDFNTLRGIIERSLEPASSIYAGSDSAEGR